MTELEEAISRLNHWIHVGRHTDIFTRDMKTIIAAARESIELKKQSAADVLLLDDFLKKFAAAFAATPMPSTIEVWGQK